MPGPIGSVLIACHGLADQTCTGALTGTADERKIGSKVIGVTARKRKPPKPSVASAVVVDTVPFSVVGGHSSKIQVRLNRLGRRLLSDYYKLPVTLHVLGTGLTPAFTFAYPRITAIILYGVAYAGRLSKFTSLTFTGLPERHRSPSAVVAADARSRAAGLRPGNRMIP